MNDGTTPPPSKMTQDQKRQKAEMEGAIELVPATAALFREFKRHMDPSDALALTQTILRATVRTSTILIPE